MLYQITVKVDSNCFVKAPYVLNLESYRIGLEHNGMGQVTGLRIQKKVPDYHELIPRLIHQPGEPLVIELPAHNPHREDMIQLIQHIESLGSFLLGIQRIHWDQPAEQWIAEDENEQQQLNVTRLQQTGKSYEPIWRELTPTVLTQLVQERVAYTQLVVPLSFYREGINEFRSFRYVNVFYNFYFFLEGLYSGGKTKNYQAEESFKKSAQVMEAVRNTLRLFREEANARHREKLISLLREEGCVMSDEGIVSFVVKMRGNLHHFSINSSKRKGHPLNQQEFETVSFLLHSICTFVVLAMVQSRSPLLCDHLSQPVMSPRL